jgi:hypothetical protein
VQTSECQHLREVACLDVVLQQEAIIRMDDVQNQMWVVAYLGRRVAAQIDNARTDVFNLL